MANNSRRGQGPSSRVYKPGQVHKRRLDKNSLFGTGRGKEADEAGEPEEAQAEVPASEISQDAADAAAPATAGATGAQAPVSAERDLGDLTAAMPSVDEAAPSVVGEAAYVAPASAAGAAAIGASIPDPSAPAAKPEPVRFGRNAYDAGVPVDPDQLESTMKQPPIPDTADGRATLMDHSAFSGKSGFFDDAVDDFGLAEAQTASKKHKTAMIAGAIVAVLVVAALAFFAWNRWGRFDDHADMQGEWYVVGTSVPVAIDGTTIKLTDDVSYNYAIDPNLKTIHYTFGPLEGQGHYWFSEDRKTMVITDGDSYTGTETTIDDLLHDFTDFAAKSGGQVVKLPEGEGIIAFSRTPDNSAPAPTSSQAASSASSQASSDASASASSASASASSAAASSQSAAAASTEEATEDEEYVDEEEYVDGEEEYTDEEYYDETDEYTDEYADEETDEYTDEYTDEEYDGEEGDEEYYDDGTDEEYYDGSEEEEY